VIAIALAISEFATEWQAVFDKWRRTNSIFSFLKEVFISDWTTVKVKPEVQLASILRADKISLGEKGAHWAAVRRSSYASTQEFLQKCQELEKAVSLMDQALSEQKQALSAARRILGPARFSQVAWQAELLDHLLSSYRALSAIQHQQLGVLKEWSHNWTNSSLPLEEARQLGMPYEYEIQIRYSELIKRAIESLEGVSGQKLKVADPALEDVSMFSRHSDSPRALR